ncbi:MAG TPA: hypothetical protein VI548_07465, partial [Chitinophagaceae bacterium]|nr:hypothetical protein [Chitinophagaceae bacterium]
MKSIFTLTVVLLINTELFSQLPPLNIIPQPVEVKQGKGYYPVKNKLSVTFRETGEKKDPLFNYLRDQLKLLYNITVVKVVAEKDADLVFLT